MKKRIKKRSNKRLKAVVITGIIVIAALIFVAAVNIRMILGAKGRILTPESINLSDYDCILVLGAGVRDDGSPSHMLEDRLLTGISLFDSGVSNTILMSGDHGRVEYDEVNTMKNYAVSKGVPAERIFLDHAGFSTYDSLYRAKEIFGAEKVVIVTQEYHLYRALAIADSLGIEALGVSADLRPYYGQFAREVREVAARAKDFFYILFKPEPVVLGETISFDDSGEVTDG
ncbi:MAG: SanA protein [Ruminococcaceae bacterium]|nr:SanA protein [Oscillospiraceae bacterium]